MHHQVWGLQRNPFCNDLDLERFYEAAAQREALARMRYLVAHKQRLGAILGDAGAGKSLILRRFAEQLHLARNAVAHAQLIGLSSRELLWQLAAQLHASPRTADDSPKLWQRLENCIVGNQLQGVPTLLLLDDVDQAGPDLLTQLVRLVQWPQFAARSLTIIFSASSRRATVLGNRLADLLDLRIELDPWEESDTVGYVQFALLAAGADRPLFEEDALAELHRLSGGVPRQVNRLAEYALLVGASLGLAMVDVAIVQEAHDSLHPDAVGV